MDFFGVEKKRMKYIDNSVITIKKDLNIKEKLDLHISKLENDCIICYQILLKLSKQNVVFAEKLEKWKLYYKTHELKKEIIEVGNKAEKQNSSFFLKWFFSFLVAPLSMLFLLFKDNCCFCINHIEVKFLKEQRLRKLIIYSVISLVWLTLILCFYFFVYSKWKFFN